MDQLLPQMIHLIGSARMDPEVVADLKLYTQCELENRFPNLKSAIIGHNIVNGKTVYLFSQDFTVFGKSKTL